MKIQGVLISFEGIDCAGKTTIIDALPRLLTDCKVPIVTCGERRSPLKNLLQGERLKDLSPLLKTYLFASDRAWSYEKECLPALRDGKCVLWDRYVASAIAYRSADLTTYPDLGFDLNFVRDINKPFRKPDLGIYIDINVKTSIERANAEGRANYYTAGFLERVREKYFDIVSEEGYISIDGDRGLSEVTRDIASTIRMHLPNLFA